VTASSNHGSEMEVVVENRPITLSRLDKVLWPETGFTKGDLIEYYRAVAPALLPHLAGRPVTQARFPDGLDGPAWYQINCRGRPPWMRTRAVPTREGGTVEYCVIDDLPSLVWVANQATIELHPLLWTEERPEEPTAAVLDLDPGPPATIVECCRVALRIRSLFLEQGLECFPKTTGAQGLHLYIPLNTPSRFDRAKDFARGVAAALASKWPEEVVDKPSKGLRKGRVFVDWGQNEPNRSTVAAYSLRSTRVPAVSTPLLWDEVKEAVTAGSAGALGFGPAEVLDRLEALGDLFLPVTQLEQRLLA
jgi:bifunctional non-homologous end joining protein LigD